MEFLRRRIGLILQTLVSALIIAWLMRIIDWRLVWSNVRTMDAAWIVTGFLWYMLRQRAQKTPAPAATASSN